LRIRADEHVAPAIVAAINAMALSSDYQLDSVLETRDRGSSDVHWITKFAAEGGEAILTADTDFLRNPPQVAAIFRTGVKVIHLPPKWANAQGRLQAAHILLWWARIEVTLKAMKPRECFRPPWNIQETGELQKVDIPFQASSKKLKKAARRRKAPRKSRNPKAGND
jgi:PIN like domain